MSLETTSVGDANVTNATTANAPRVVQLPTRSPARRFSVAVNSAALRRQMRERGLTGAELARRARVSAATVSHALNGRRIHPAKFRAIAAELHKVEPVPGTDGLVDHDQDDGPRPGDG